MSAQTIFNADGSVASKTDTATVASGTGTVGPAGPKGDKGDQGIAGVGVKGDKGDIGPAGIQGAMGTASTVAGPAGPSGPAGADGAVGPVGPVGPASTVAGPVGPVGPVGPKGDTGAQLSNVGPNGLTYNDGTIQYTAFPGAIALTANAATCGPPVWINGATLSSTYTNMLAQGTTLAQTFNPPTASGFYGCMVVNYSNSANPITIQLYNATDAAVVWTSPNTIGVGTVTGFGVFQLATYPMAANKSYVWRVMGSGAATAAILPQYYIPSSVPYSTQYPASAYLTTSTTLSSTAVNLKIAGTTNLTQYYRFPTSGFFNYAIFRNFSGSSTPVVFQLLNSSGGAVYQSPSVAAGATVTVGPFGPGSVYLTAINQYMWGATGSGSATCSVDWAYVG